MRNREQSGFSLIELLIVIAVIAILAAIAIPSLLRARDAGDEASAIASLRTINSSQHAFSQSCARGFYATVLSDLAIAPTSGGVPFISPDLGAGAPSVLKSGYNIEMSRGSEAVAPTTDACNGVVAASLGSSYYAFADPVGANSGRHFWINANGTIYYDFASLSGQTRGLSTPTAGSILQ